MNASRWITAMLVLGALAASARAEVQVRFVDADRFTDSGPFLDRGEALAGLESHFRRLGELHLGRGQALEIEVLDVDLAGRMTFARGIAQEVRILRGKADWPRIHLRYVLKSDGKVQAEGVANLADLNYMFFPPRNYRNEPLAYEKRMLDNWFRATFAAAGTQAAK